MEVYDSPSEDETFRIGESFGSRLRPPATVLLTGDLGAGKTVFVKGIVAAFGIVGDEVVRSPSFSLVNVYDTPAGRVYHVDLYRLNSSRDLHSIGFEEILASDAVVIIEWAEKLAFPIADAFHVRILADAATGIRRLEITETPTNTD
ncbi:MAG: tRNA (adenosine(37)-N6)-threonylcarbamoyltransferase complex ATPase subunit type 1 TsaE [Acidobacteria bacterium]|nr:MAG: tRNA (adenosine(37)-N6)-threonylcarbamoyltransferase complex ATPase subunit type 1 TsaE [Acidobacteriota bacterium]